MSQETLTSFFGWMAVINIGLLLVSTITIVTLQDWVADFHSRLFRMGKPNLKQAYFRYLAKYKLLTLVFCVVPWLALHLI
ncbi:DUF6868 family protein [Ruegeria sp.]|uniref:DUF6868 family protein n=1 Tax=Ruegeria sp. TaxID=1879320 RepID=UPI003B5CC924